MNDKEQAIEKAKKVINEQIIDWACKEGMTDVLLEGIIREELAPLFRQISPAPENLEKELEEYMTDYKDAAERHALAEDPDESAKYLVSLLQPYIEQVKNELTFKLGEVARQEMQKKVEQAKREERKTLIEEVKAIVINQTADWGSFYQRWQALEQGVEEK